MRHRKRLCTCGGFALLLIVALLCAACGSGGAQSGQGQPSATPVGSAFTTTVKTTDGAYIIQFGVTPNHLGTNTFTVQINDASTGKLATNVTAQLALTMLDMDMGTQTAPLQSSGQGKFSAQGQLSMSGRWEVRILVHSSNSALHEATVTLNTTT